MALAKPKPQDSSAAYARVQRKADAEILRALRDAAKDVNARLRRLAGTGAAELERSRLLAIKQTILQGQAEVFEKTGRIIEQRRAEAAARAIQVSGRYDEVAFEAVGREAEARALARGLEATEARAIDTLVARVTGSRVPLAQRVYNSRAWAGQQLERRINSALARGLNAEQFAAEIRRYVNPNTPGGTRYAALRLARTEINNAYHAMAIRAAQLKPWVTKVEWHTSKSHARKDICDQLNGRLFAPDEVPAKPHPQCMCYITPVVDEDDDDFLDRLVEGEFDDFLDQYGASQGVDTSSRPTPGQEIVPATPAEAVPAGPQALQIPTPTRGRDMVQEILEDVSQYDTGGFFLSAASIDSPYVQATRDSGPTDKLLTLIAKQQGYRTPTVADRETVSQLVQQGWTEGHRGTKNHHTITAERQMEQLRTSEDFELGTGIYGNGMYVSEDSRVADQFAGRGTGGSGVTVRMAISPNARFADWATFKNEHKQFMHELHVSKVHKAIIDMFYDPGVYAAALGYDGVYVEDEGDGAYIEGFRRNRKQWVIFNREVLVVERENG